MGEIFRPWQRKVALVLLALALFVFGCWSRSLNFIDILIFPNPLRNDPELPNLEFCSRDECLVCSNAPPGEMGLRSIKMNVRRPLNSPRIKWGWYFVGIGKLTHSNQSVSTMLVIPYQRILIPLTVVTFIFMLLKPSPLKPKTAPKSP